MKQRTPFRQRVGYAREIGVLVVVLILSTSAIVRAQTDEVAPDPLFGTGIPSGDIARNPQSEMSGSVAVPYSQVFRDTDTPVLFRDVDISPTLLDTKLGRGGTARITTRGISTKLSLPFFRAVNPADAELKIGNFYLDIRSLSGSLLVSDNVNATPDHRELGTISIVRLDMAAMYKINESFQVAVAGALIYLPYRNEIGVEGFGKTFDPGAQFGVTPLMQAQVTYDMLVGNWDLQVYDQFRVSPVPFGARLSYTLFDEAAAFDEQDRAGRYVYGGRGAFRGRTLEDRSTSSSFDSGLIEGRNAVGGKIGRVLPTETRMEVGALHSDYLYLNDGDRAGRFGSSRDQAYVSLISQRETLRFKPFANYTVSRYNYNEAWDQEVRAGIRGPITENIRLLAGGGYYRLGDSGNENFTASVRLEHTISPTMQHSFAYDQRLTEPARALETSYSYRFTQTIADGLVGVLYGIRSTFEDLEGLNSSSEEWRAGLQFTYVYSPKTTFRAGVTYTSIDYGDPSLPNSGQWVARAEMFYKFTPTFEAQVRYQYTDRFSDQYSDTYRENLGVFTLIKYF